MSKRSAFVSSAMSLLSVLILTVCTFSEYGAMPVSAAEAQSARAQDDTRDFNWVIYIDDKFTMINGPMRSTVSVNMKAVNTSGDIEGHYNATGSSTTTNDMNAAGGRIAAPAASKIDNFSFDLKPYLAPLVKDEPPAPLGTPAMTPAPLVPDQPDFSAEGSMDISSAGVGTVSAGGMSVPAPFSSKTRVHYTLTVNGPTVELTVDVPQIGQMFFKGFIRGEGKK